ncbi:MAG: extracellular solute-binding protein [Eubacteriales bacterium]
MSTIKDVALLAGVSIGTVSNYLSGVKHVQPETAKKIKDAVKELDYRPNTYAKNLRTNKNCEIGVVLPNANEQYYTYLLAGIEAELKKAGYYLNLAFSGDVPENEIAIIDNLMKKNICGLIVMSCLKDTEYYDRLSNTPILFIDRKVTSHDSNFVSFNQYDTMTYLLSQLFEHGCKKIALIAGSAHFSCEYEYASAYRDFMKAQALDIDENLIRHINMTKEEAFRTGISFFQDYSPDAVISTSRILTSGLEQAASLAGISLYDDMVMVSIGQETLSNFLKYNNIIVTMRPANFLGANAARLLLSNIDRPLMFEKQQIILSDKIIGQNLFEPANTYANTRKSQDRKLRLLFLDSPNAHGIIRTHSAFTRKTGIDVDITLCEHGSLLSKLMDKDYLSHFDVCMYDNPWLDILVSKNCFLNITDYINSDTINTSVFLEGLLDKVSLVNGKYYGVPFLFGPQLLLYRRDLFENPQLCDLFEKKYREKLRVPRTWFEFNVISSFFTRSLNPNSPVDFGVSLPACNAAILIPELMPRVWAYNGRVFDDDGNPLVNSTEFKKGVNSLVEAFSYAPPQTLSYTVENTVEDFYLGKTAMLVSFASFVADVSNNAKSKITGKIGYASIPGMHSVLGSWGLAIPQGNADPSAALEFMRWTCDPEMSSYFAILDGQSPLKNVYINDELTNHYPWLPLIFKTYSGNRQRKSIKRRDGSLIPITVIETLIYKHIINILHHTISAEEAMATLDSELSALL